MQFTSNDPIYPEVQGPIMLPLNLHVVWSEGYAVDMLRGVEAIFFNFLVWFSQNLGLHSALAKASLRASLIDLDNLRNS